MSRKGLWEMKLERKQESEHSNKPRHDSQIVPKAESSICHFSKSYLQHGELKNLPNVFLDIITSWATQCQSNTLSCLMHLSKLLQWCPKERSSSFLRSWINHISCTHRLQPPAPPNTSLAPFWSPTKLNGCLRGLLGLKKKILQNLILTKTERGFSVA